VQANITDYLETPPSASVQNTLCRLLMHWPSSAKPFPGPDCLLLRCERQLNSSGTSNILSSPYRLKHIAHALKHRWTVADESVSSPPLKQSASYVTFYRATTLMHNAAPEPLGTGLCVFGCSIGQAACD
jgi:hypothetical protein